MTLSSSPVDRCSWGSERERLRVLRRGIRLNQMGEVRSLDGVASRFVHDVAPCLNVRSDGTIFHPLLLS